MSVRKSALTDEKAGFDQRVGGDNLLRESGVANMKYQTTRPLRPRQILIPIDPVVIFVYRIYYMNTHGNSEEVENSLHIFSQEKTFSAFL